jgi:ubiquinone/menaquinone biosynthesis C-methylase UbiE
VKGSNTRPPAVKKFSYQKTIDVYNKLGGKYLSDSLKIKLPVRGSFQKILPKKAHILDVGCGGGRDAQIFLKHGFKVTGIDASRVLINLAKKKISKSVFKKMDVLKLTFPPNSFDAIWAQAILLHLKREDIPKVLKSFYKIVKPGGYIHINVKKGKGEEYVREELSGGYERFYTYFSKKEIENLIKKQGFKIIRSKIMSDPHKRKGITWINVWGQK